MFSETKNFLLKPWYIMLIGLPGSGKSTFSNFLEKYHNDYVVLSTDYWIENHAKYKGKTYNEVFEEYIKIATEHVKLDLDSALEQQKNIIHDQTNLSRKKRESILKKIPKKYYKIAIIVTCDEEERQKRLKQRPGKIISVDIDNQMKSRYEIPLYEEGFDLIEYYHTPSLSDTFS